MNILTDDIFQTLPPAAVYQSAADDAAELKLTFHLAPESHANAFQMDMAFSYTAPVTRNYLTADALEEHTVANDEALQKLAGFVVQTGAKIESSSVKKREVSVSGTLGQFSQLLGITFHLYRQDSGNLFLAYHGHIRLPDDLRPYILNIEGLNIGLSIAHVPSRRMKLLQVADQSSPLQDLAQKQIQATDNLLLQEPLPPAGYSPQEIAEMYHFPDNLGEGQTVGIIALGGAFQPDDLAAFCTTFNLVKPDVKIIGEEPSQDPQSKIVNDVEVNMDIQMVAGIVPKAKIVVYYADSFQEGFQIILDDTDNEVSVISTSWASGESFVPAATKAHLSILLQQLSLRGITVLAASGDDGIYQIGSNYKMAGINLPAGFDRVIACGGTTLYRNGIEQVWLEGTNASGGAFSNFYPAPAFQNNALTHYFRNYPYLTRNASATPDVSVNASGVNHAIMIYNGKPFPAAGTSVATPIIAGLIARLNTSLGYRLGYINPFFYQLMGSNAFASNIPGNNGLPSASVWDPCTGLGSPNGNNLLNFIKNAEKS
ncbi:hypothetical protein CWS43_24450 [Rahnella sp. AA]|uniref:S53 family peptidase n=1 Tax=Rahnella sp. AA TaxID=2057180 RepID=UPI000C3446D4|nr:S53 family peptidase [Rahnella sp. AA]PKE27832.1 hypothetical protein CWS43_24450 [Rahnella sp. AA]